MSGPAWIVIAIPKPIAAPTAWLVELSAAGPFATRELATEHANELRADWSGSAWSVRVAELRAPDSGSAEL